MKNIKMFSGNVLRSMIGGGIMLGLAMGFFLPQSASAAMLYRQLQLGMRGADVSDLQVFLATDATIYPQGLVTGYFGSLTKSAVSNFQARNGIATVGRVGPQTMAVINAQMAAGMGDRISPMLSSISVSPSTNTATINWNTNENAAAIIYYSTSPIFMQEGSNVTIGGSSLLVHTDLRSSHTASLSGLNSNTTYYYVIYVRDGSGNESISWPATFNTNQ
jgi:hypothetical protein